MFPTIYFLFSLLVQGKKQEKQEPVPSLVLEGGGGGGEGLEHHSSIEFQNTRIRILIIQDQCQG